MLGFTPWERKADFLRAITLVMGQRNRLSWDIPAADSFLLNQAIYRISDADYKRTLDELDELLELAPIMRKPVRNLSLGERMKCELAAGLLHRPQVLFLDEPTIGLDITAQARIRAFLAGVQPPHRARPSCSPATTWPTSPRCASGSSSSTTASSNTTAASPTSSRRIAPFKLIGVALRDGAPDAT